MSTDSRSSPTADTAETPMQRASSVFTRNDSDPFGIDPLSFPDGRKKEKWSVSWSDLMMTMFILFVVLYVYQAGNRELEFGIGPGIETISSKGSGSIVDTNIRQKPSDIYNYTRKAVSDEFVDDTAAVDMVEDRAVRIALAGDLFFDLGRAELKPQAVERLRQVASILKENSYIINVVGHTDSTPNHSAQYPTNWELSTARACRATRFLIEEAGVSADRFFVSGHSLHQPIAPNNNAANRKLNRRVEIILMKERPFGTSQAALN